MDPLARTLKRNEATIGLSRRSFDLLLCLVQNSGKILSKDELLKQIWPDTFVDENSLAKSVSVLRKALDENSSGNPIVLTLPGRGYQFAVPVELVGPRSATEPADLEQANLSANESGIAILQQMHEGKLDIVSWMGKAVCSVIFILKANQFCNYILAASIGLAAMINGSVMHGIIYQGGLNAWYMKIYGPELLQGVNAVISGTKEPALAKAFQTGYDNYNLQAFLFNANTWEDQKPTMGAADRAVRTPLPAFRLGSWKECTALK